MGTWGAGNFDNDAANDYIDDLCHELADQVEQCFAVEGGCDLEETGEGTLIPTIEILSVLCEYSSGLPPEPERVAEWKQKYLAIYDEEIDYLDPTPEHKVERRRVIEDTFAKLEKQSQGFAERVASL